MVFVCCVCMDCVTSDWLTQIDDVAQIPWSSVKHGFDML